MNTTVRYILILVGIAIIFLVAEFVLFGKLLSEIDNIPNTGLNTLKKQLQASGDTSGMELCSLDSVDCDKEKVYEISCYTGYESHGANGRNDNVSVATYQFPQGQWIYIDGIGKRRVDTVTAKWVSHRIDVWFGDSYEDYQRCLQFGVQKLAVTPLN